MSTADESSATLAGAVEIGLALQQQRERKHISLEDVARELHLTPRQMAALESGRFAELRGAVFVKGYLRACAKLYGMDGDALVRAYERIAPQVAVVLQPPVRTNAVVISASQNAKKYGTGFAALLVLLVIVVVFWQWPRLAEEESKLSASASPAIASNAVIDSAASDDDGDTAEDAALPATAVSSEANLPSSAPTAVLSASSSIAAGEAEKNKGATATTNTADGAADTQDSVLHMEFSDNCWVQIKDQAGKILHEKNYSKGEVLDLTATPPLYVWLGRAAAANVSYNGALVSVPMKTGAQSARFVLGDDAQANRVE